MKQARDKFDLLRFDASGSVSSGMFSEDWPRYVVKMATGSGKTKVLSLPPKVRDFMRDHLLSTNGASDLSPGQRPGSGEDPSPSAEGATHGSVDLEDPVVIRNLSEPEVGKVLYDSFKTAINALTITDSGSTRIEDYIRLSHTRPFRTDHRPFLAAKKCLFTKTVGEANSGGFELSFAAFLEAAPDVQAFAKNYFAVGFKLDYVKADGDLSNYVPDFIVRDSSGVIWIIETKGRKELDLPQKMARLKQWCADATAAEENGQCYDFIFVDQESFEAYQPATFAALATAFTEYKS